ncbi:MAG: hypothetical protein Q9170_000755 [Blastenia crenularia]
MRKVSEPVGAAVNREIARRIKQYYQDGKKLKYQSPKEWVPNAAFANCYSSGNESVGYHNDELTYLGPRAIIGSLSLGVAREFRVRKIVARGGANAKAGPPSQHDTRRADAEGQIAIHLPHNSLLVMHAEMQEEWFAYTVRPSVRLVLKIPRKHSIHPTPVIDPHPISGSKRINSKCSKLPQYPRTVKQPLPSAYREQNPRVTDALGLSVTYRHYRPSFQPRYIPRCKCNIATVLRCVQRKKENRGRYMWMCHAGLTPGKEGCTFFQWAEFDDDGEPPWAKADGRK